MNGMDDGDVKPDAEPSIPLRRFGATHEIASLVAGCALKVQITPPDSR